jgi:hypothetical protein
MLSDALTSRNLINRSRPYMVRPFVFAFYWCGAWFHILWQRFHNVIEAQPDGPAMVIESYWEQQGRDEEDRQNELIIKPEYDKADKVDNQDGHLRRHNINQDCADKETFLAHKQRVACRAMMFDFERTLND